MTRVLREANLESWVVWVKAIFLHKLCLYVSRVLLKICFNLHRTVCYEGSSRESGKLIDVPVLPWSVVIRPFTESVIL